jgi:predicted nucleic acid-binding protein
MVERVHASQAVLYLSVVTELEAMVKPEIEGDYEELERIKDLLAEDNVRVVPLRRRLAQQAAVIRARHRLSTTDAIIVATAEAAGCDLIVGNDRQWRGRTAVPYLYLDDLNASP